VARSRRFLSVTPAGVTALRKARRAWASMSDGLEEIREA